MQGFWHAINDLKCRWRHFALITIFFPVYTIDTIWFKFNFDFLWWKNPIYNIITKILTQFSYCENTEMRISSSSPTSTRNYSQTTWVLLKLISGTYTNTDVLFTWQIEGKKTFFVISDTRWSRVWLKKKHEKLNTCSKIV